MGKKHASQYANFGSLQQKYFNKPHCILLLLFTVTNSDHKVSIYNIKAYKTHIYISV